MEYRDIKDIKLLERNPRTITAEDFSRLKKSIKDNPDYFEARPLILSDRTGELVIIAGNQRYKAAQALKMNRVPTFLLQGLSEEREREIIIRDNVTNGEWDWEILANEWDSEFLSDIGVIPKEFTSCVNLNLNTDECFISVLCDDEDDKNQKLKKLTGMGYLCS